MYSEFFLYYDAAPLLIVNANQIDLVNRHEDFAQLVDYALDIKAGGTISTQHSSINVTKRTIKEQPGRCPIE